MSEFIHQELILDKSDTKWHEYFSDKEYLYLKHALNGILNNNGGFESIGIEFDKDSRTLHIYEPFVCLNYLGYLSPSVVSIKFVDNNKIQFLSGDDNGIGINSPRLSPSRLYDFPNNLTSNICFWHFVDAIGQVSADEE